MSTPWSTTANSAIGGAERLALLPDGRRLAYAEYGVATGPPVLYFHGAPSSQVDVAFTAPVCRELGVRMVAVDRPGIGLSDRKAGRTVADWAADIAALLRDLALDRCALLGWSAGGPYALACAHALPQVVSRVAIVGGMAPLDSPAASRDLGLGADRLLFPLSRRAPTVARGVLRLSRLSLPSIAKWTTVRALRSPADRAVVSEIPARELVGWFAAAMRRSASGIVDDYRALGDDWGFPLEEVDVEVVLFHGDQDEVTPLREARALAARLPRARLRLVPDAGHFLLRRHAVDVLTSLL